MGEERKKDIPREAYENHKVLNINFDILYSQVLWVSGDISSAKKKKKSVLSLYMSKLRRELKFNFFS